MPGCPPAAAQPSNGLPCVSPGLQCPYTEECCCGECAPYTLTCTTTTTGASQWQASSPCTNPTCGIGCQEGLGKEYIGTANTTTGGFACQAWSDQDDDNVHSDLGNHNYCRNPDADGDGVWCYATDPDKSWDQCPVPINRGMDYNGTANITTGCLTCQAWSVQEPHPHDYSDVGDHNYCRNPNGDSDGVWCYTTDPEREYDYCPVSLCGTGRLG